MSSLESVGQHPISLKVMRVSRPSLGGSWQPFFSSSPAFSAHSTAHVLSLQGSEPLPNHPKTLRDLTQAGTVLTLPAAFGAIQLGETFACVLCVNNEAGTPVDAIALKIEMQTITSKVTLAEVGGGGASRTLSAGDTLETVISHEIKELGQHVLACTVTYRTPPGMRPATSGADNAGDPFMQTFRKFYKFAVTNPLSVKTKVHVPRSPSALLSQSEREKVFLEVHIQNLTQGPLWFEKIRLEAVEGWDVEDANIANTSGGSKFEKSIFSGNIALMSPQDTRQYIYIMNPKVASTSTHVPVPPAPGTTIPLGRLDISWRSAMGEPGRLLTSVLSRRIPLPAPPSSGVAPVSAIPPYLQKTALPGSPARPRSPSLQQQVQQQQHQQQQQQQQQQQRVGTPPPPRPGSPFKRAATPGPPAGPQSPGAVAPPAPSLPNQPTALAEIEVDLVLLETPPDASVRIEKPFSLRFALVVSANLPYSAPGLLYGPSSQKERVLRLAVQHTLPTPPPALLETMFPPASPAVHALKKRTSDMMSFETVSPAPVAHSPPSRAGSIDVLTPRRVMSPPPGSGPGVGPGASTPGSENAILSPTALAVRRAGSVGVGVHGLSERLRRVALREALGTEDGGRQAFGDGDGDEIELGGTRLPGPYLSSSEKTGEGSGRVSFAGTSVVFLPPIVLCSSPVATAQENVLQSPVTTAQSERGEERIEFVLHFLPRARGFARIGGLRVLLVEDREQEHVGDRDAGDEVTLHARGGELQSAEAQMLREWDVVAEVWVR
ncbi:DUF974-domain-containing protein [Phellopilus nigrolimitatus]|nr:DUF974-domain-containing protein [Phellopilus nigrolimitatus]